MTAATEFDFDTETARAYVHLEPFAPVIDFTLSPDRPTDQAEILQSVMSAGILVGIITALQAVQGEFELDYDSLIPDTPEGLL